MEMDGRIGSRIEKAWRAATPRAMRRKMLMVWGLRCSDAASQGLVTQP
jgi:hypothetical protein